MSDPTEREILSGPPEHSLEDDIQDDFEHDPDSGFWDFLDEQMGEL